MVCTSVHVGSTYVLKRDYSYSKNDAKSADLRSFFANLLGAFVSLPELSSNF